MKVALKTKVYAAQSATSPMAPFEIERRDPRSRDVAIEIKYCGMCHSDLHTVRGEWEGINYPAIPGHEIVGVVTAVGSAVTRHKVGDTVGVGCMVNSCRTCDSCKSSLEQFCTGKLGTVFTYNSFDEGSKTPTYGGYSTNVVVDEDFVLHLPKNLPLAAAAPLLCAGITTYSPLKHWNVGPGKVVGIVGMGGLGHMGLKIAKAMGAKVYVISQSLKKRDDAIKLGAEDMFAASDPKTFENHAGKFDVIIDTISAKHDLDAYLGLLKMGGALVTVGAPPDALEIHSHSLIAGRKILTGSLIGGLKETQEMLDFCGKHNVVSEIEIVPIQKVNEAFERMLKSDVRYRFVIDMASLK